MSRAEKQPWKAAVLALAYPGLGHLYLREWTRAVTWFALLLAIPLLSPSQIPAEMTLAAFRTAGATIPFYVPVLWAVVTAASVGDAYRQAQALPKRSPKPKRGAASRTQRCPHCNRELTESGLEFCQWCAEPLDAASAEEDSGLTPW